MSELVITKLSVRVRIPPIPKTLELEDGGSMPIEDLDRNAIKKIAKQWGRDLLAEYDSLSRMPDHHRRIFSGRGKTPPPSPPPKKT